MHTIGALLFVGLLAIIVFLVADWTRLEDEQDSARRTSEGFITLIEGLYAYRSDTNITGWPTDFNALLPYLPNLQFNSSQPLRAGANGHGHPYVMSVTGGNLMLSTSVDTQVHAQAAVREFGSSASYVTSATRFTITVGVPDPGGISLVTQTLLTDGSNAMRRPLMMTNTVTLAATCSGSGLALTAAGQPVRCTSGTWQAL